MSHSTGNPNIHRTIPALLLTVLAAPALFGQPGATLHADLNHTKAPVSPTLYGLMTEEINYSYDGGLYAELIRNRTFRADWSGILNWFLIENGTSSARVSIDAKDGPSKALASSAKLEVLKADAHSPAGLLNEGYWGFAVRPNTRYTGSFFAKTAAAGALPVKVALVADQSGAVLATADVPGERRRMEAVQIHDGIRGRRRVVGEPPRDYCRSACYFVAPTRFPVSADVP